MDEELFTATDVEPPSRRSRRSALIAVSVALAGGLIVAGTGTAFAIQAGHTVIDNLNTGESPDYIPLSEREDVDPSQFINPTPTATTLDGIRRNAWGTPLYDGNSDPALVTMPTADSAYFGRPLQLHIDQQFIAAKCMFERGFDDYTFSFEWERTPADQARGDVNDGPRIGSSEFDALHGILGDEEYRWQDAGCWGYAVHVTGQDDAN